MIIRCSSFVRQCKLCTCLTVYFLRPYARIQPNLVQSLFYVKGNHFKWTRSQFELLIITPPISLCLEYFMKVFSMVNQNLSV